MTEQELLDRILDWIEQLGPLGIGHFAYTVEFAETPFGVPGALAGVNMDTQYESADFQFSHELMVEAEDDPDRLDATILHELMHVVLRDYERSETYIYPQLAGPVQDVWARSMEAERESVVDRVALTLLALANATN